MTRQHPPDDAAEKTTPPAGSTIVQASAGLGAGFGGAGIGALYAARARLALTGIEDFSDRRAAHLRRAKTLRAKNAAAAKDIR